MSTVAEWCITEVGYIWIKQEISDDSPFIAPSEIVGVPDTWRVFFDTGGKDRSFDVLRTYDLNFLFNLEVPPCAFTDRVMAYWRQLGYPKLHRNADYEPNWFPWNAAGFTFEERDAILNDPHCNHPLFQWNKRESDATLGSSSYYEPRTEQ